MSSIPPCLQQILVGMEGEDFDSKDGKTQRQMVLRGFGWVAQGPCRDPWFLGKVAQSHLSCGMEPMKRRRLRATGLQQDAHPSFCRPRALTRRNGRIHPVEWCWIPVSRPFAGTHQERQATGPVRLSWFHFEGHRKPLRPQMGPEHPENHRVSTPPSRCPNKTPSPSRV